MDQATLLPVWDVQIALFSRMAVDFGIEPKGHAGSQVAALKFAESLKSCANLEAATECLGNDVEAARSFLREAHESDWLIYDRNSPLPSLTIAGGPGPFYFLAYIVSDMLIQLREFDPASFT